MASLIDSNDVYSLFDVNGFARLHVADIDVIPRVDAVEVVRCRDCKHRIYVDMGDEIGAVGGCELFGIAMHYDCFCSYGERKDADK